MGTTVYGDGSNYPFLLITSTNENRPFFMLQNTTNERCYYLAIML
jgi:hypothetical protein